MNDAPVVLGDLLAHVLVVMLLFVLLLVVVVPATRRSVLDFRGAAPDGGARELRGTGGLDVLLPPRACMDIVSCSAPRYYGVL